MDHNPEIRDRLNVNKSTYLSALSASSQEPVRLLVNKCFPASLTHAQTLQLAVRQDTMSGHDPINVTNYRAGRNNFTREGGQLSRRHFQIGFNNMTSCIDDLNNSSFFNLKSTQCRIPGYT